jgi:proline iminopeptidase
MIGKLWNRGSILLLLATSALQSATDNQLQSKTEGKVSRGNFDLHYTVVGNKGPYVLVLSGGPGEEIRSMQAFADELSKNYQCIMLEQRGTGRSKLSKYDPSTINLNAYMEDIEALREHLGADKLILTGNSWGMMLALAYGGSYPNNVKAIATVGSGPITRDYLAVFVDNKKIRLSSCEVEIIEYWSDPSRHAANFERAEFERVRVTAPAYFYNRRAAIEYEMELTPDDFNPRVAPAFLEAEGAFDLRPQLKRITAPVLLLQGRQDLAGEANISEAHALIKNSTLIFLDKCGHLPWLEQPKETWKIVNEFLRGLP